MTKIQLYEAIQDERDKPKPAVKPIEQWDATELLDAMLYDAAKMPRNTERRVPKNTNANQYENHRQRTARTLDALQYIGRPCSRAEIAELMGVSVMTAYDYVRPLVMAGVVTTDRHEDKKTVLYVLVDGYDGQFSLDI